MLTSLAEKLVPISDFSQGKAGRIFSDVAKNNSEYIVLKNNQPTAVVVSVDRYKESQEKLAKFEKLLELAENEYLLKLAAERKSSKSSDFAKFVKEQGFSLSELESLSESVEIEWTGASKLQTRQKKIFWS